MKAFSTSKGALGLAAQCDAIPAGWLIWKI